MPARRISVLLSHQNRLFSKTIYWITGRKYTHASIRLEGMGDSFFSFNFRGFCEERPKLFCSKRTKWCILYQLEVPESTYEEIRHRLEGFLANRASYHYSRLGLCLCLLRIPHKSPGAYVCSQFVAELLVRAGVISLRRDVSICLPNTLEEALVDGAVPYHAIQNPSLMQEEYP